jgi:hypothetical protein
LGQPLTPQRVAFYELIASSLKVADTLANVCPADTARTPVGRMKTMRKRLAAVRAPPRRDPPRAHSLLYGGRSTRGRKCALRG